MSPIRKKNASRYVHVEDFSPGNNQVGEWVYAKSVKIAEVLDYRDPGVAYDHLHFEDYALYGNPDDGNYQFHTNPLRLNGLSPSFNIDHADPQIDGNYLRIQPDGSNQEIPTAKGKVDFIIAAKDILPTDSNPNNRGGLARIRYSILEAGLSYENVILDGDAIFNNNVLDFLYCSHCGGGDPYGSNDFVYYYITNNITSGCMPYESRPVKSHFLTYCLF